MLYDTLLYTNNDLRSIIEELELTEDILNQLAEKAAKKKDIDTAILLQQARKVVLTECFNVANIRYERLTQINHPL